MRINYCGNEIEINLEVGEVTTLAKLDSTIMSLDCLIDGEQGITDPEIALENESWSYMLEELEDINIESHIDIGFTQVGMADEYETEVKIDYISII